MSSFWKSTMGLGLTLLLVVALVATVIKGYYSNERRLKHLEATIQPGMSRSEALQLMQQAGFHVNIDPPGRPRSLFLKTRTGWDIDYFDVDLDETGTSVVGTETWDADIVFSRPWFR